MNGDVPKVELLGQLQVLDLKPGDTVVVTCEAMLSREARQKYYELIELVVGGGVTVLILDGGDRLGVIRGSGDSNS